MIKSQKDVLVTAVVAGNDRQGRSRDLERFGQKFETHQVGGVVHWWCGQLYFQCPIVKPGHYIV